MDWYKVPGANKYSINRRTHEVRNDKKGRILVGSKRPGSYPFVCLIDDEGKASTFYIHRIIAELFVPRGKGCDVVNHKDFDKENNAESNLEWTTHRSNMLHFWDESDNSRASSARKHPNFKLKRDLLDLQYEIVQKCKHLSPKQQASFVKHVLKAAQEYN